MTGAKGRSGGRNRLPTERKRRQGTLRKHRMPLNEPQPEVGLPAAPAWLNPRAKAHYDRIGKHLVRMRVVTVADGDRLALLAHALDEHQQADELVARDGLVLIRETEGGAVHYRNPAMIARDSAWRRVVDGLRAFGMDPQSRSAIDAIPEPEGSDLLSGYLQ